MGTRSPREDKESEAPSPLGIGDETSLENPLGGEEAPMFSMEEEPPEDEEDPERREEGPSDDAVEEGSEEIEEFEADVTSRVHDLPSPPRGASGDWDDERKDEGDAGDFAPAHQVPDAKWTFEGPDEVDALEVEDPGTAPGRVAHDWFTPSDGEGMPPKTPGASSPMDRANAIKAKAAEMEIAPGEAKAVLRKGNVVGFMQMLTNGFFGHALAGSGARPMGPGTSPRELLREEGRRVAWPTPVDLASAAGAMAPADEMRWGMEVDSQHQGGLPARGTMPGLLPRPPAMESLIEDVSLVLPTVVRPGAISPPKPVALPLPALPPRPEAPVAGEVLEPTPPERTRLPAVFQPREGHARSQSFVLLPEVKAPPARQGQAAGASGLEGLFRPQAPAPAPSPEKTQTEAGGAGDGLAPAPEEGRGAPEPLPEAKRSAWSKWWLAVVGGLAGGALVLAVVLPMAGRGGKVSGQPEERRAAKVRFLLQEQAKLKADLAGVEREIRTTTKGVDLDQLRKLEERRKRLAEASKVLEDQLSEVYQGKD